MQDWLEDPELPHHFARVLAGTGPDEVDGAGNPRWQARIPEARRLVAWLRREKSTLQRHSGVLEAPLEMVGLAADAVRFAAAVRAVRDFAGLYGEDIFGPADVPAARQLLGEAEYARLHGAWARYVLARALCIIDEVMGEDDADASTATSARFLASRPPGYPRCD